MPDRLITTCVTCGYPTEAGHSKDCDTRKSESDELRKEGYELFVAFLKKHGIDGLSQEEKIERIKEMDFDKIMQVISRLNGRLAFRDKHQEWEGKAAKVVVGSTDDPDLEPPENAERGLELFFGNMKQQLNSTNLNEWAVKTYFAIIYSHAFGNGNGRTARNVFYLMRKEGVPPQDLVSRRIPEAEDIRQRVGREAMKRLFIEAGIQLSPDAGQNEMDKYIISKEADNFGIQGEMAYLKFLAARRVLQESGMDVSDTKLINISNWDDKKIEMYKRVYSELRKKWFMKIFKVCDDYKETVGQYMDHI